jgi:hypothetical protein
MAATLRAEPMIKEEVHASNSIPCLSQTVLVQTNDFKAAIGR